MAIVRDFGKAPVDALVIGGGIAGCTLAYELARRGLKATIIEQSMIAAESSGRNTGTLLSGPQREVVELLDASVAIYAELADGPVPFEFAAIAHLLISDDEASFEAAAAVADRYRAAGVPMEKIMGKDLARDHPRIGFKVAGGYSVGRAWTLEPMGATHAFAHAAREAGATIRTGLRVAQIFSRGGKVQGVLTDQGIVPADLVFIANGLWMSDLLRRTVGDGPLPGLPLTAGRGWLIQLGKLDFELPWIVEELTWPDQEELGRRMRLDGLADVAAQRDDQPAVEAICLNPMRGGDARLGASVQPAFRDLVRNTDMASRIAGRTLRMLPGLGSPQVKNVYPGNRPMLSDGLPVAGRTAVEGLFVHGGMGSIGMHAAPATARWLVDAALSGDGNPAQEWLCPDRFPGWGTA
ncbi:MULTISPECIES: FAD-dependent oxidoreductase [unclassified Mesorhizobium]|uniref:NAD(P)/FAD-dependent oxidoreductase n=1 Tax=unclassified Mesorhizobium TaxID=325217 RepID=UPI00112E5159|nr:MULTISPECIES: FAD-dependent oxidoreductase [unclassified Mesorhizobium]TPN45981.1 FAD-binding oxidoreductase [Mesorhizobium sp. B1-1-9]TPN46130.1 FAD-binding oxidoreductase [Mesorhizobium sp. B1-1-7]